MMKAVPHTKVRNIIPTSSTPKKPRAGAKHSRPRPVGKHWLKKPPVVLRGKREICNPATGEGRAEYKYRTMLMWVRQDGLCCFKEYDFCPGRLHLRDATFQHEKLRGKDRDERIWDPEKKRHLNGAAHAACNLAAGSRRLPIFHGSNSVFELKEAA